MPVPDKVSDNNEAERTITVPSMPNVNPIFTVMRSVNENAPGGTNVGDPIKVFDPDDSAGLDFSLDEAGKKHFTVSNVGGNAQIQVKPNVYLDYEDTNTFQFTVLVSDKKTVNGNTDAKDDAQHRGHGQLERRDGDRSVRNDLFSDPSPPVVENNLQLCMTPDRTIRGQQSCRSTTCEQVRDPGGEIATGRIARAVPIARPSPKRSRARWNTGASGLPRPTGIPRNAAETPWKLGHLEPTRVVTIQCGLYMLPPDLCGREHKTASPCDVVSFCY